MSFLWKLITVEVTVPGYVVVRIRSDPKLFAGSGFGSGKNHWDPDRGIKFSNRMKNKLPIFQQKNPKSFKIKETKSAIYKRLDLVVISGVKCKFILILEKKITQDQEQDSDQDPK